MALATCKNYRPKPNSSRGEIISQFEYPEEYGKRLKKEPPWRVTGYVPLYVPLRECFGTRMLNECWRNSVFQPFYEALQWLEAAKFNLFWATFEDDGCAILDMLDSYLTDGPRVIDRLMSESFRCCVSRTTAKLHAKIHTLVLQIFHRLSYQSELEPIRMESVKLTVGISSPNSLPHAKYLQLMDRYRVFSIPRLMDLCALYGQRNEQIVRNLLQRVMVHSRWIAAELPLYSHCMLNCLEDIQRQCDGLQLWVTPKGLDRRLFDEKALRGVVLYLLDYSYSLRSLGTYSPTMRLSLQSTGLLSKLPHLFEHIMKVLIKEIHLRFQGGFLTTLKGQVASTELNFVSLYCLLISQLYLTNVNQISTEECDSLKAEFIRLMESIFMCTRFLKACVRHEPGLLSDIRQFLQPEVNEDFLQRLQEAVELEPAVVDSDPKILLSLYMANSDQLETLLAKEKFKAELDEIHRFKESDRQDLQLEAEHRRKVEANSELFTRMGQLLAKRHQLYEDDLDDSYDGIFRKWDPTEDEEVESQFDVVPRSSRMAVGQTRFSRGGKRIGQSYKPQLQLLSKSPSPPSLPLPEKINFVTEHIGIHHQHVNPSPFYQPRYVRPKQSFSGMSRPRLNESDLIPQFQPRSVGQSTRVFTARPALLNTNPTTIAPPVPDLSTSFSTYLNIL